MAAPRSAYFFLAHTCVLSLLQHPLRASPVWLFLVSRRGELRSPMPPVGSSPSPVRQISFYDGGTPIRPPRRAGDVGDDHFRRAAELSQLSATSTREREAYARISARMVGGDAERHTSKSPYQADLVARHERVGEELRVSRALHARRRRSQYTAAAERERQAALYRALEAEQAAEVAQLRAEKRQLVLEQKRLKALHAVERTTVALARLELLKAREDGDVVALDSVVSAQPTGSAAAADSSAYSAAMMQPTRSHLSGPRVQDSPEWAVATGRYQGHSPPPHPPHGTPATVPTPSYHSTRQHAPYRTVGRLHGATP